MKRMIMFSFLLLLLTACNMASFEDEQTFTLDATGVEDFVIDHDAGEVTVTGVEGTNEITVRAVFVAESDEALLAEQFIADKMEASLTKDGTTATLKTKINYEASREQGQLHLDIEMPNDLAIDYRQNEGPLTMKSIYADIAINHGTKSVILEDINGNIKITDGSGGLHLKNVVGELTINKNSGNIELMNNEGDVTLIAGSADVDINTHNGNITLRSGSGNVIIDNIDGDVNVIASRKGELVISNVSGTVIQPE